MIELRGNIWDIATEGSLIVITTNGFVRNNGAAVMGRGIALEAKNRHPMIENILGSKIRINGNIVQFIHGRIIAFPVKPISKICEFHTDYVSHMKFKIGNTIPGWACKADIEIIRQSCTQLVNLLRSDHRDVYIGRMGCGAGELDWGRDVKLIVESILINDKFKVCTF